MDAVNNIAEIYASRGLSLYEVSHKLELYTTAEPCPMCMSAIIWSGITKIYFGTSIETLQKLKWQQIAISSYEINNKSWTTNTVIQGGLLEDITDQLYVGGPPWLIPDIKTEEGPENTADACKSDEIL
jgi:tRNA(adenine34) deaminase